MGVILVCDFTNQFSNIRTQWNVEIQNRSVEETSWNSTCSSLTSQPSPLMDLFSQVLKMLDSFCPLLPLGRLLPKLIPLIVKMLVSTFFFPMLLLFSDMSVFKGEIPFTNNNQILQSSFYAMVFSGKGSYCILSIKNLEFEPSCSEYHAQRAEGEARSHWKVTGTPTVSNHLHS